MAIEISVALIAIAFVVLVIYLVITLLEVRKTLKNTERLVAKIDFLLEPTAKEANKTLSNVNVLLEDISDKSERLDSVFNTVSNVGNYLENSTHNFSRHASHREIRKGSPNKIEDWLELAATGVLLWQKYKKER